MDIISKFTVASEQGLKDLFFLQELALKIMYENVVEDDKLNQYIRQQLNYRDAINELNTLTNQLIILYVNNNPAGFAIIKQTAGSPEVLEGKRVLHYAHFNILSEFDNPETRESLWQKCYSISKSPDAIWMEILQNDPLISFFENCGFLIHKKSLKKPFDQPSYILIRQNTHNN